MLALNNAAADAAALMNDIVSYRKEIELDGELNNGVLVVQRFLDCDPQQAVEIVNDLRTGRLRQFERVVAAELPALFGQFDLDTDARDAFLRYVKGLADYAAGLIKWHPESGLYKNPEPSPLLKTGRPLDGPTGLGTAAAHISAPGGVGAGRRKVEAENDVRSMK